VLVPNQALRATVLNVRPLMTANETYIGLRYFTEADVRAWALRLTGSTAYSSGIVVNSYERV
jgi:hypothetical protein